MHFFNVLIIQNIFIFFIKILDIHIVSLKIRSKIVLYILHSYFASLLFI